MKNLILTAAFILTLGYYATAQVGVGTDTPQATLEVQGNQGMLLPRMADHTVIVPVDGTLDANEEGLLVYNTTVNKIYLWDGTAWSESTDALTANNGLTKTGTNVQLGGALTQNTDITTGNFDLNVGANTLFVDGSANRVGIGTTTPERPLHTIGGAKVDFITLANSVVAIGQGIPADASSSLSFFSDTDFPAEAGIVRSPGVDGGIIFYNEGNGNMTMRNRGTGNVQFGTNNSTDLTIADGGNVGIGTTNPVAPLDLVVPIATTDDQLFRVVSGNRGFSILAPDPSDAGSPFKFSTGNSFMFRIDNNPSLVIGSGGLVSIDNIPAGAVSDEIVTADANGTLRKRTAAEIVAAGGGVTSDTNLGNTDQTLTANRALTTGNFDLNIDANTLVVDGSANRVGIGTSTPARPLHTIGGARVDDIDVVGRIVSIGSGNHTDASSVIRFFSDTDTADDAAILREAGVNGNLIIDNKGNGISYLRNRGSGNIRLGTNNSDDLYIVDGGNVGIGTSTPTERLDVNGEARVRNIPAGVAADQVVTVNTAGNVRKRSAAQIVAAGGGVTNNLATANQVLTANRNITTGNFDLNVDATTLYVDGSANRVGIGTGGPGSTLDVRGTLTVGDGVAGSANNRLNFRRNDGNVGGYIAIAQGTNQELQYSANSGGGFHAFRTNSTIGPQEKMRIANNGNVGIGTNAPARPLDVNGQARVRNIPAGATADEVVTVNTSGDVRKRTTQQVVETRVMAGAIFIGDVDDNDNATITTPTALRGFVTSGVENGSCGGGTNDDACITVNFANIGTTNYVVNVTYRTNLTNVTNAPSVDSSGEVMVPVVYDKTATSFKVFVEATSNTQQSLWLDFILMKY